MAIFNTKEEFRERILKNQDKDAQCLVIHRFIGMVLQEKYQNQDVEIDISPYAPDRASEYVVIDKATNKVLESYQEEDCFNCNILDMVYNRESGETKLDVIDEREFDRVWQLYRSVVPEEVNEDKSFETIPDSQILWIPVDSIKPSPFQIRENFDDVSKLAESIKEHGLFQPINVKLDGEEYILVDGERRWRAVKSLGWKNIRAIQVSDEADLDKLGLIGNFQRSNPNAIALARKIAEIRIQIKKENKWGKKSNIIPDDKRGEMKLDDPFSSCKEIDDIITKELGFSRTQQYNLVKILREPEDVQEKIRDGELTINEGVVTINLSNDLPEEFVRALRTAEQRQAIIDKIEKKAKDTDDPNAKILKYFSQMEKVQERYKVGFSYFDKADDKTREDLKARVVEHINFLTELFGLKEE